LGHCSEVATLYYSQIGDSPVGRLLLAGNGDGLHALSFGVGSRPRAIDPSWLPDTGGETISYLELANRVIGANGSLTGFGGGIPIKRALLELEKGQRTLL